ncbi:MAG: sugar phosphate isomerase/epimerase family protein [Imperialibacter sp.]|uniref:sugar phosphate isomerase/epimerase family protein n=1 Tax=Imperialibacter sp. TaxID=2038411 RepID=UPI003A8B1E13
MNYNRRDFIRTAGAVSAGALILPQMGCSSSKSGAETAAEGAAATAETMAKPTIDKFGIQLYSVRDVIPADPKGTMKQLAGFGYKQFEGYEGPQGMFWGMSHTEFKAYMDEIGVSFISSHCNVNENFEEKCAQAAEIGMKHLIAPWIGPQKTMDEWKVVADKFNAWGETAKKAGIRFAYHNHGYTFEALEGQMPQDFLIENTDPAVVDFQMDIFWVVTPGADPIAYFEKYPGRWVSCHIKDREKDAPAGEGDASCIVGTGSIDYAKVLSAAKASGVKYYVVEQEKYANSTPMDSAKADAEYVSKLVFA